MSDWVEAELAECQRQDARHTKRLARLFGRLSERPVGSIPMAWLGRDGSRLSFSEQP